MTNLGGSGYG